MTEDKLFLFPAKVIRDQSSRGKCVFGFGPVEMFGDVALVALEDFELDIVRVFSYPRSRKALTTSGIPEFHRE